MESQDEVDALERADRLISEGVIGERGQIASIILEAVQHERDRLRDALECEYERGKRHGDDDRKLIEQQNRVQAREIDRLKGELGRLKKEAWMTR